MIDFICEEMKPVFNTLMILALLGFASLLGLVGLGVYGLFLLLF